MNISTLKSHIRNTRLLIQDNSTDISEIESAQALLYTVYDQLHDVRHEHRNNAYIQRILSSMFYEVKELEAWADIRIRTTNGEYVDVENYN